MPALSRPNRYGVVERSFHWLTFALVGAAYLLSVGGPETRVYSDAMESGRRLHETIGITVLAVTLLRLIWRAFDNHTGTPPMPLGMALAARLMHLALYLLLIAIPLTAIVGSWLEGHPVTFVGANDFGPWLAPSHDLGATFARIHSWAGNAILWLAGLHAAAALFHHFVLRDAVLTSMLPSFADSQTPRDHSANR